nr:MAG TPA_asm: hypothetical protein [Caudoviricetes sp.]DAV47899.1 MAG TPA: hypothetical protein [Caudoviricetes sp.]
MAKGGTQMLESLNQGFKYVWKTYVATWNVSM